MSTPRRNDVNTIQYTGNSAIAATSSPVRFERDPARLHQMWSCLNIERR